MVPPGNPGALDRGFHKPTAPREHIHLALLWLDLGGWAAAMAFGPVIHVSKALITKPLEFALFIQVTIC